VFDFVARRTSAASSIAGGSSAITGPAWGFRIAPHFYTKSEEVDLLFADIKKGAGG